MKHSTRERDRATVDHLNAAADSILAALQTMPNRVDSVFDPASDVPKLEGVLQSIRLMSMYRGEES